MSSDIIKSKVSAVKENISFGKKFPYSDKMKNICSVKFSRTQIRMFLENRGRFLKSKSFSSMTFGLIWTRLSCPYHSSDNLTETNHDQELFYARFSNIEQS